MLSLFWGCFFFLLLLVDLIRIFGTDGAINSGQVEKQFVLSIEGALSATDAIYSRCEFTYEPKIY